MLDPPKVKFKPIPIPAVLLKCPEIQSFPSLLATQGSYGGIRVPVPMNEFVDCVKFVHEVRSPKTDLAGLDEAPATIGKAGKKAVKQGIAKALVVEAAEKLLEKVCEATTSEYVFLPSVSLLSSFSRWWLL
jgi:hypothetical protein